jgi:RimJ/RimL family protein N-acetyltransferase
MSTSVTLEAPFPLYCVPRIWDWLQPFYDRVYDDSGPKSLEEFVDQWVRAERNGRRSWGVIKNGGFGGVIVASSISPWVAEMHCIFRKEFWGHENTIPALEAVADLLISEGIDKVTAGVAFDNHGLIALLKKLGGVKEGGLKGQLRRKGEPTELIIMAIHKEAYNARRRILKLQPAGVEHGGGDVRHRENVRARHDVAAVDVRRLPAEAVHQSAGQRAAGANAGA